MGMVEMLAMRQHMKRTSRHGAVMNAFSLA
jgi:hypothetical protein